MCNPCQRNVWVFSSEFPMLQLVETFKNVSKWEFLEVQGLLGAKSTKTSKTTFNNDQPRSAKSLVLCLETDLFTFRFLETNQQ